MFLLVTILSQPLFHSPDEYLVILNPFATYFTNRRCKNVKNLFVSLVNLVISYDCTGYVSPSQLKCRVSLMSAQLTLLVTKKLLLPWHST